MNRVLKIISILLCSTLMILAFTGCSNGSGGDISPDGENTNYESQLETTTVRLALSSNGHIFNAIAEEQGYLADEGLTVEYVPVNNDVEVFDFIKSGKLDIASNSGTNLPLQQIAEGQDLTIFGGYLLTGSMPVIAKVETKWDSIEDLIGKRMACEPNLYALTGPLLDMGYDPLNDITWLEYDNQEDRIKAVKSGEADFALVGTSLNYEVNSDPELKVCTYASDVLPDYSCCRVEASTEWVNNNPNTVKALLKAWIRAMAYYDANHEESVALMVRLLDQDEAEVRAYMDNPHCQPNVDPMKSSVVRAWDYMDRLGLLDSHAQSIDINEHINTEIYEAALNECQAQYGSENRRFYEKMQAQFARNNR